MTGRTIAHHASPMAGFALASLAPVALLLLGALAAPAWFIAALLYLTILAATLDRLIALHPSDATEGAEFPAGTPLLVALALCHIALVPLAVWTIAGPSGLSLPLRVLAFLAFGLQFGQVSVPAAHELIHRDDSRLRALGVAIYVTLLFGHHASAHRLVHHRHVATPGDPNTARRGEGFYRFAPRAWAGSFRKGYAAERALSPTRAAAAYAAYLGGAALCLGLGALIAGPWGAAVWAGLALHATAQLLLSDYVQHYGLARAVLADGRPEPVSDRHSWNAPQRFSAAMMLNAPRHSDHHAHPARPYPALRLPPDVPLLPRSLPVMATLALVPRLWRRRMNPRLDRLTGSRESEGPGTGAATTDRAI